MADRVIVVGTSAGGLTALRTLVGGLSADIQAPICVVQHIGRRESHLPKLLGKGGPLPAVHAADGEPPLNGHIYVAPPDRHLLVAGDRLHLTRGPRENFSRPAIDPLFRSAAESYGPDAIGVILTGLRSDGAAGLYEVKRRGGIAVVQAPEDAEHPDMPRNALTHITVDYCVAVIDMPPLLMGLVASGPRRPKRLAEEAVSMEEDLMLRPSALTCPECGGAVRRDELGTLLQYRCHIGHSFTGEAMVAAQFDAMEKSIEAALRHLERIELCRQLAEQPNAPEGEKRQVEWHAAMGEAQERAEVMKQFLEEGWRTPEV